MWHNELGPTGAAAKNCRCGAPDKHGPNPAGDRRDAQTCRFRVTLPSPHGCFSRPVKCVGKTRIFARGEPNGVQIVVYAADLEIDIELAMVLPIPCGEARGRTTR